MNLATLGARGTDVIVAGLKLQRRFSRAELIEAYGKLRRERDGALPQWWQQGISNELHRLSSDFAQFHKEGRKLDLIARTGLGHYCFRDEARPKLIEAANERSNLCATQNVLVLPIEGDEVAGDPVSHLIGAYAHQRLMAIMRSKGYRTTDTSIDRSYDFTFCGHNRFDTTQIMECKGTRRGDGDVAITPNEVHVMALNPTNYWLGVVYSIDIVNGNASGGTAFITPPLVLTKWHITATWRLRRMPDELPLFKELGREV